MNELNQILQQRRQKADELVELGTSLFVNDFKPTHRIQEVLRAGKDITGETPAASGPVSVAGRVVGLRNFGKAAFLHVQDETERLQVYVKRDLIGQEAYASFKKWDVGDIAGFTGPLFRTKTDELTIQATAVKLITKSFRTLPEKFHGLTDVETRYRQRYVDLIVNPEVRDTFRRRVEIIHLIREFLVNRHFMEVETPMMHPIAGGAVARPFRTYHNALGMDLYLRIAPELYLKRLLVGGFERIFEINRNFRNEGLSTRHNPEFTMLEFYQAYATFEDLMDLTEEMISWIALEVCGSMRITYQGQEVDLSPPWQRFTMDQALVAV
ncbi:MAG: lysine--tRNA ligase, partial [Deltaproteobacteria bacterium CG23_combo_of_CG06-09_8_20_14_all_60_8]